MIGQRRPEQKGDHDPEADHATVERARYQEYGVAARSSRVAVTPERPRRFTVSQWTINATSRSIRSTKSEAG